MAHHNFNRKLLGGKRDTAGGFYSCQKCGLILLHNRETRKESNRLCNQWKGNDEDFREENQKKI